MDAKKTLEITKAVLEREHKRLTKQVQRAQLKCGILESQLDKLSELINHVANTNGARQ